MLKPERAEILHELLMGCLTQVLHLLAQHRVARLERLPNPRLDLTKRRLVAAEIAFDTQARTRGRCIPTSRGSRSSFFEPTSPYLD
jgi:hypothetical protein